VRTGFATDLLFEEHRTGPGHPERPERIAAILKAGQGLPLVPITPRDATRAEIEAVHAGPYIDDLARPVDPGGRRLDADTVMSPRSYAAAVRAAGAALAMGEALLDGRIDAGFACVRPPGHHACPAKAMGFCLFNNVAILARFLVARGKRVCILDWDVHHGNGTQEIFWNEPEIGFCSLHQFPLWPGSGARDETGAGNVLNIPLPPGSGDADYFFVFDREVLPWLEMRDPDVLLISAGFDAHSHDPLAQQEVTTEGFAAFTRKVLGPPILAVLEGGYDLDALGASVRAHLEVLLQA